MAFTSIRKISNMAKIGKTSQLLFPSVLNKPFQHYVYCHQKSCSMKLIVKHHGPYNKLPQGEGYTEGYISEILASILHSKTIIFDKFTEN